MNYYMANASLFEVVIQLGRHGATCCTKRSLEVGFEGERRAWGNSNVYRDSMATRFELRRWIKARYTQMIGELLGLYAGHGSRGQSDCVMFEIGRVVPLS